MPVAARTLVGRSPACFLKLGAHEVSGEHAIVQWSGDRWTVRDLGSRNGTYLDGRRLEVGSTEDLKLGARLSFGDPEGTWVLADDGPPQPVAIELKSRDVAVAQQGLLAIPSDADPEVVVYQRGDGEWVKEEKGEMAPAAEQDIVYLENQAWALFLPGDVELTPVVHAPMSLSEVTFRFAVSRDEEHVELTLVHRDQEVRLEPREHLYVLLTLARARVNDGDLPDAERGWLGKDDLQRMLRMRANALNVSIHRARQQLGSVGLMGAAGIVEVRRGLRRFGTDRVEETSL